MHLVLGLGNPGRRYQKTRHNAGFLVVDRLGGRWGGAVDRKQMGALVRSVDIDGRPVLLAKPQSFMNRSGQPAASLRGYYRVTEDVVVVHDDVDIPFGQVRVKKGGGSGGHNGLRDIKQHFGDLPFLRVRVGVSRPPTGGDTIDHVLGELRTSKMYAQHMNSGASHIPPASCF